MEEYPIWQWGGYVYERNVRTNELNYHIHEEILKNVIQPNLYHARIYNSAKTVENPFYLVSILHSIAISLIEYLNSPIVFDLILIRNIQCSD